MKFAPPARALACLLIAGSLGSARSGFSQQSSSSPSASAAPENRGAEVRQQFSQSLAQGKSPSQDAEASLRTGLLRGQSGDFAGAIQSFQQTLKIEPNDPEAHYNLGLALVANGGSTPDWKDARPQFEAAVAARPSYAQAQHMVGVALLESGEAGKAVAQLRAALGLDPSSAETHFD
jgi:tetratricopeptide (TPR) repeat protein